MVDRAVVARRTLHGLFAFSVLYYGIPDPMPPLGVPKPAAALLVLGAVFVFEVLRIRLGFALFLIRDYEKTWLASYFWLGAGCVVALLFFPAALAVPAIIGTSLVDPVIGEVRKRVGSHRAAFAGLGLWVAVGAVASAVMGALLAPPLLVAGAAAAVLTEGKVIPRVDDDFVMTVAALLVMAGLSAVLGL